ncbi:MAG: DoxX family protein [Bacteroidota bacterium]
MKKTNILYWVFTGLFAFFMFGSAVPDVLMMDLAVKGFADIGLTSALVPFLGIAKTLGVIAILVPGFPRIKEWAYAGLMFDLIGAVYLIAAIGKFSDALGVFIPMAIGVASYIYYHKKRKAELNSYMDEMTFSSPKMANA